MSQHPNWATSETPAPGNRTAKASAWPAGVIARYLTVGGATVDITQDHSSATARCNGCTDSGTRNWMDGDSSYSPEAQERMAKEDTRRWAQNHSSTCRAMPNPGGDQ